MKTFTKILLTLFVLMAVIQTAFSQQQIQFNGLISNGFGLAGWNADGTGPEPRVPGILSRCRVSGISITMDLPGIM